MGWKHVQGSGAQTSSGSNHTLTATFSGAVAAGDLIVVSGAWYATALGTPTVADCVNWANYTYKGPTVVSSSQNLGTWEYVTPKGALPGTFTITFTVPGTGGVYPAMTIDEFNYATGATYSIDSSSTNTQAAASSISLASALSVSGTDLIYAAGILNGSGTASPGSGFTLAYNEPAISGQCLRHRFRVPLPRNEQHQPLDVLLDGRPDLSQRHSLQGDCSLRCNVVDGVIPRARIGPRPMLNCDRPFRAALRPGFRLPTRPEGAIPIRTGQRPVPHTHAILASPP